MQLEAVEEYGDKYEIKFNPDKTYFMIFNQKITRNSQEKRLDTWQEEIMLNGKPINQVPSMKYLGVHISDDDKNKAHIDKRKKAAITALARLNRLGFTSQNIHPNMKGHLYNTYIRPVLYYGLENYHLNKYEKNALKRIEGNIIKTMNGVPTRCRSSCLMNALKIEPSHQRLEKLKCDFFTRLNQNTYTKSILDNFFML